MVTLNERLTAKTKQGSLFRRRKGQKLSAKTNGADLFLGAVITLYDETAPAADLCQSSEPPAGILMELADDANNFSKDAQDPIATLINIKYANPSKDDEFLVCLKIGWGCTKEHICVVSDEPGYVAPEAPAASSIASLPPFRILGKFMETITGVAGKNRYVWVKAI